MDWGDVVLSYLAEVGVRSLVLFLVAGAVMAAARSLSAAARHAVWTVVTLGMLSMAAITPALPPLPIRVWKAVDMVPVQLPEAPSAAVGGPAAGTVPSVPARMQWTWQDGAAGLYALGAVLLLARLAYGYLFTRRLVRAATPIPRFEHIYSSGWISAPLTIGRKILLPADWEAWDAGKLDAVLAHERSHVRRGDWAIALIAGINRSVFWFHPLAWWLEHRLAALAEHASDDSALLLVESRPYAQALLEMAAAVKTAQGRVVWEAMAMAKVAEVRKRIDRILDETRQIPRGLTRARWMLLIACSLPLVWLAAVTQLTPAVAQDAPKTPAAMAEYLKGRQQLTPSDASAMEQYLAANPQDLEVRLQLVLYYYANGVRDKLMGHVVWLVANHPESKAALVSSRGVLPRDSAFNTLADYERVREAWKSAVEQRQNDALVLGNAAQFMVAVGDPAAAEGLLMDAAKLQPSDPQWKERLGKLYALAILEGTGDARYPQAQPDFTSRVRNMLATSEDGWLLFSTGNALVSAAQLPQQGRPLPDGVLNLNEHPLLRPAVEFGNQLMARAQQFGGPRIVRSSPDGTGVIGGVAGLGPAGGSIGGVPGGVRSGVMGGVIGAGPGGGLPPGPSPQTVTEPTAPTPPVIKQVDPVYPPLARQARISGVVKVAATIGTDGTMKRMMIISGHPLLVPAALEALKQWTFQPPVADVTTTINVPFTLPPGEAPPPLPPGTPQKQALVAPMRIRVGGNVQAAKLLNKVEPFYPPQARAERVEGDVTLKVTIGEDGRVEQVEISEGNPILGAAAMAAVQQWRYQTTLLNNQPVTVETTVVVPFRLD